MRGVVGCRIAAHGAGDPVHTGVLVESFVDAVGDFVAEVGQFAVDRDAV